MRGVPDRWSTRQLTVAFTLATFGPLVLLAFSAVRIGGDAVRDEARARVAAAAQLEARAVSIRMHGLLSLTSSLSTRAVVAAELAAGAEERDLPSLQHSLDTFAGTDPAIASAALVDPTGQLIAVSPPSPSSVGESFASLDWFKGAAATAAPYASEAYEAASEGHPRVVSFAAPVRNPPGAAAPAPIVGYATLGYRLDAVQQFVDQFDEGQSVSLTVTDQRGVVLAAAPAGPGRALTSSVTVPDLGWTVRADVLESEALAGVRDLRSAVTAIAAALAGVLLLALIGLRRTWRARAEAEDSTRRSEAELAQAQTDARIGSWQCEIGTGAMRWSDEFHRLLGRPPGTGPAGSSDFLACVHPDDLDEFVGAWNHAVASQEPLAADHRVVIGEMIRWLHTRGEVMVGPDGSVVGLRGTSQDITTRKQAEMVVAQQAARLADRTAELQQLNLDLSRSNGDLEQFAYVASHDLSEPLRAISGPISLLARRYNGRLDEDADTYIGFAVDGCQRMQQMIDELLVFSRVGRMECRSGLVDCNAVMRGVLDSLRSRIAETSATVTVGPLPTLTGEVAQLTLVLQNLVANAMKFTAPGVRPEIAVAAEYAGGVWRITVTDNGIGIEPRHRERIFGMFKRLHGREEYPGTGIGLALVRKIVEHHGGSVGVEDAPGGRGSRFWFTVRNTEEMAA